MVEEDVHNHENGDGFDDAVSHEICCKVGVFGDLKGKTAKLANSERL